jgi:hypothetical protein
MALDPRISLAVQVPDMTSAIDIFQNTMLKNQNLEAAKAQEKRSAELFPLQQQQAQQSIDINNQNLNSARQQQRLQNINVTGQQLKPFLESGDFAGAENFMLNNISNLQSRIEAGEDLDLTESMETLQQLQNKDYQGVLSNINAVNSLVLGNKGASSSQRERNQLLSTAQDQNATELERNTALRALGAMAKVSDTAAERTALNADLGAKVVEQKAAEAQASESGKSKAQLKFKPQIAKAVKLAEKAAIEKGDVLTDLARMEASLPGIKEATNELIELSSIATSTLGGRAFDFAVKESGFGSTKGADARAKLIAIVDNQVLPLLKETFGAAFTVQEGENLKASLVDPNASPAQKREQLSAFLAQKERNIRTKQSQLNQDSNSTNEFEGFKVVR